MSELLIVSEAWSWLASQTDDTTWTDRDALRVLIQFVSLCVCKAVWGWSALLFFGPVTSAAPIDPLCKPIKVEWPNIRVLAAHSFTYGRHT